MNAIKPLTETADTVTLSRADYDALLSAREDVIDAAAFDAFDARIATEGRRRFSPTTCPRKRSVDCWPGTAPCGSGASIAASVSWGWRAGPAFR